MTQILQIGATVRIETTIEVKSKPSTRLNHESKVHTISRRGLIATIHTEGNDCNTIIYTLILEQLSPVPLIESFLITPMVIDRSDEEIEVEVSISEIKPLLSFEHTPDREVPDIPDNFIKNDTQYKQYADTLFQLHDYTNAIRYYEAALHLVSSRFTDVGGTVVARRNGHCVIAELDCVDTDNHGNTQCEVTLLLPNGDMEEAVISSTDILLAVWDQDATLRRGQRDKSKEMFLQTRILLNLCRCFLHFVELDITDNQDICTKFKKAAVLSSSIAITLCEYYNNLIGSESKVLTSLLEKARILRSKSFIELNKLPNALADVKKVFGLNPSNREACELMKEIQSLEKYKKKIDRKLSKEVCKWVQSATGDL